MNKRPEGQRYYSSQLGQGHHIGDYDGSHRDKIKGVGAEVSKGTQGGGEATQAKDESAIASSTLELEERVDRAGNKMESSPNRGDPSAYPGVTWLPAVVVPSEEHSDTPSYVIDGSGARSPSHGIPTGTIIQLPAGYPDEPGAKIIGIVLDHNTVFPINSVPLMDLQTYGKYCNQGGLSQNDGIQNPEATQGNSKSGADTVPIEGGAGEMVYSSAPLDASGVKDMAFYSYCNSFVKDSEDLNNQYLLEHGDHVNGSLYFDPNSGIHASLRTCPSCGHQLRKLGTLDNGFSMAATDGDNSISLMPASNILMGCPHCGKEFTFGPHIPEHHVENANTSTQGNRNSTPQADPTKRHFCKHCDKSYKHNRDLRKHLRSHHNIYDVGTHATRQPTDSYNSGVASQPQTVHVDSHVQSAKQRCEQCMKMFRGPFELRRHVHTVHENKRPYKCSDCNKLFRDAYELKRHSASHQRMNYHTAANSGGPLDQTTGLDLSYLHSVADSQAEGGVPRGQAGAPSHVMSGSLVRDVYGVPPHHGFQHGHASHLDYFCTVCDKNFRGANEFKRHYSVVHEKKYRYKCIHCGKLWRDQYDLKRHCRRSHFLEREVDKGFIRQCLLDNTNEQSMTAQAPITMTQYEIPKQVALALDPQAAAVLFGTQEQECRASSDQFDQSFSLVDTNQMSIARSTLPSPSSALFPNMSTIPSAGVLYPTDESMQLGQAVIHAQDASHCDKTKIQHTWADFEANMGHNHNLSHGHSHSHSHGHGHGHNQRQ